MREYDLRCEHKSTIQNGTDVNKPHIIKIKTNNPSQIDNECYTCGHGDGEIAAAAATNNCSTVGFPFLFPFSFKFRTILAGRPYHLLSHTSAKWKPQYHLKPFEFHGTNSAFKCAKYTEMEWELREGQHRPKVQPHKQTTRIVFELLNFARIQCTICVCYQCECALFSILKGIVLVFCIVFRVVRAEAPVLFS